MDKLNCLLDQQDIEGLLENIELAVWLIACLILVQTVLLCYRFVRRRSVKQDTEIDWTTAVETAYDTGKIDKALRVLATYELHYPKSALVKFWQGKCYFRQESWEKAAKKFEASCRLEPPYRRSVRDYMAFIELNALVPGIEGYIDRSSED